MSGSKCRVGSGKERWGGAESKDLLLDTCAQIGILVNYFESSGLEKRCGEEPTLPLLPLGLFSLRISGLLSPEMRT